MKTCQARLNHAAIAAAFLSVLAPLSHAQSGVAIYGLLDVFGEYRTNNDAAGHHRWAINSGGMNTSRLGFRGSEDLGGGLRAVFQLESEVNLDTGQANAGGSQFWSRQANVGLENEFGRLVAGRSYSTTYDFLIGYDPMGYAPNYSWATSAGATGNRKDGMITGVSNMVKYRGDFGPISLGATVGAPEGSAPRVLIGGLQYRIGPVALVGVYDRAGSVPVPQGRDRATTLHVGALYTATPSIKLYAVARDYRKNYAVPGPLGKEDKSRLYWVGASYLPIETLTLTAAYYKQDIRSSRVAPGVDDPSLFVLRARYALSKRTDLYVTAGRAISDAGAVGLSRDDVTFGRQQNGVSTGIQHRF